MDVGRAAATAPPVAMFVLLDMCHITYIEHGCCDARLFYTLVAPTLCIVFILVCAVLGINPTHQAYDAGTAVCTGGICTMRVESFFIIEHSRVLGCGKWRGRIAN